MARLLDGLDPVLDALRFDWVVVQGDTTTAMAAAMAAYHRHVPVAHVEAGLRTHDLSAPFPEEGNRQLIARMASLHLAPTPRARDALLAEGVAADRIEVTGNTVVDAARWMADRLPPDGAPPVGGPIELLRFTGPRPLALITGHRRESFDGGLVEVCEGLAELARAYPGADLVPGPPEPQCPDGRPRPPRRPRQRPPARAPHLPGRDLAAAPLPVRRHRLRRPARRSARVRQARPRHPRQHRARRGPRGRLRRAGRLRPRAPGRRRPPVPRRPRRRPPARGQPLRRRPGRQPLRPGAAPPPRPPGRRRGGVAVRPRPARRSMSRRPGARRHVPKDMSGKPGTLRPVVRATQRDAGRAAGEGAAARGAAGDRSAGA